MMASHSSSKPPTGIRQTDYITHGNSQGSISYTVNQHTTQQVTAPPNQDARNTESSPRKSATLPAGMRSPKSGQKLSSNSFSGGFLGRLKRKFRLKSKGYEFSPPEIRNVEGLSYQNQTVVTCETKSDNQHTELPSRHLSDVSKANNAISKLPRHSSDRKANYRPMQFITADQISQINLKDQNHGSNDRHSSSGVEKRYEQKHTDQIIDNPYTESEDFEVETADCSLMEDIIDPGYETLEEVRRKMQQETSKPLQQPLLFNISSRGYADLKEDATPMPYFHNISRSGYADIGEETPSEYCRPKTQQHRRTQSSGLPIRGRELHTSDSILSDGMMTDTHQSMHISDPSRLPVVSDMSRVPVVSETDLANSKSNSYHTDSNDHNDMFLSPHATNLTSLRMNSCPDQTGYIHDSQGVLTKEFNVVYNSENYLCQGDSETELYANPSIVLRKKSKRFEDENRSSAALSVKSGVSETSEHDSLSHSLNSASNEPILQHLNNQDAPPIPERKYLNHPLSKKMSSSLPNDNKTKDPNLTISSPSHQILSEKRSLPKEEITKAAHGDKFTTNESTDCHIIGQKNTFQQDEEEICLMCQAGRSNHFSDLPQLSENLLCQRQSFDECDTGMFSPGRYPCSSVNKDRYSHSDYSSIAETLHEKQEEEFMYDNEVLSSSALVNNIAINSQLNEGHLVSTSKDMIDSASAKDVSDSATVKDMNNSANDTEHCALYDNSVDNLHTDNVKHSEPLSYSEDKLIQSGGGEGVCSDQEEQDYTLDVTQKTFGCSQAVGNISGCEIKTKQFLNQNHHKSGVQYREELIKQEDQDSNCDSMYSSGSMSTSEDTRQSHSNHRSADALGRLSADISDSGCVIDDATSTKPTLSTPTSETKFKHSINQSGKIVDNSPTSELSFQPSMNQSGKIVEDSSSKTQNIDNSNLESPATKTVQSSCSSNMIFEKPVIRPKKIAQTSSSDNILTVSNSLTVNPCHLQASFESLGGSTDRSSSGSTDFLCDKKFQSLSYEEDADEVLEGLAYTRTDSFADEYGYSCTADLQTSSCLPTLLEYNTGASASIHTASEPLSNEQLQYEDYLSSLKDEHHVSTSQTSPLPKYTSESNIPHTKKKHKKHKDRHSKSKSGRHSSESSENDSSNRSDPAVSLDSRLPDFYYHDNEPVHMSLNELGMQNGECPEHGEPIHMSLEELKKSAHSMKSKSCDEFGAYRNGPESGVHDRLSTERNRPRSAVVGDLETVPSSSHYLNNVYETLDSDGDSEEGIYELDPPAVALRTTQLRQGEVLHAAFRDSRLWANGGISINPGFNYAPGSPPSDAEELSSPPDEDFLRRLDARPPALLPRSPPGEDQTRLDFMESMRQLKDCGWYWGPLSWDEAEIKLTNKPEGTFLVRDSSDDRYILSLSFNMQGRVHHTRIEHHKGKFSFWSQPDSHGKSTIKEFIEQCVKNSRNGQFLYFIRPSGPGSPPMPVHLLYPISRYRQMRSLQHMCRFCILQFLRRDHIDALGIPTRIKDYLKDPQYYVEYLDD